MNARFLTVLAASAFLVVPSSGGPPSAEIGSEPKWIESSLGVIASREYEASYTPRGLQAPNRAQNLRTWFRPEGIEDAQRKSGPPRPPFCPHGPP